MEESSIIGGASFNPRFNEARCLQRDVALTNTSDDTLWIALGSSLKKELRADELLTRIVDIVTEMFSADRGTLYLYDRGSNELVSVAAHLPELDELRVPLEQGVAGFVARTREVVNHPTRPVGATVWSAVDDSTGYQTRSMLAAPLLDHDDELIGVVQLLNSANNRFDAAEESRFETLAQQVSSVLRETTLPDMSRRATPPRPLALHQNFNGVIATGDAMHSVLVDLCRVADTDATVMIEGESGTGKGLIARAVHHNSKRADGPFVAIDCTTLPQGLIENALFGHVKGAYTGADQTSEGLVAAAHGGTLFLDEVGELPIAMQAKLLTVLQDRTYKRVGSAKTERADVRVIAATNRDLETLVKEGAFREDLYYRLNVVQLTMPPLRERGRADIVALIHHFIQKFAKRHGRIVRGVTPAAIDLLTSYHWPGNVRELEHAIESAVIFCDGEINKQTVSRPGSGDVSTEHPFQDLPNLDELELRYVRFLLDRYAGNKSAVARVMGIGRSTLHRKLNEWQIEGVDE